MAARAYNDTTDILSEILEGLTTRNSLTSDYLLNEFNQSSSIQINIYKTPQSTDRHAH